MLKGLDIFANESRYGDRRHWMTMMAKSYVAGKDDPSWTTLHCLDRMKASVILYASRWSPFLAVVTGNHGVALADLVPVSADDSSDQRQKSDGISSIQQRG